VTVSSQVAPVVPGVSTFEEYAPEYLRIVDKRSNLVPFVPNKAQLRLLAKIRQREAMGRPVRILVLKARQLGFSTLSLGLMYEKTTTNTGWGSFFAAHDDDSTKELFKRVRLMYDMAPDKPMTRYSTKTELDFSNPDPRLRQIEPGLLSSISVGTAGKATLGRSRTLRFLHCSEVAFWKDAQTVLLGLEQALPDDAGTVEIIESTANGVGNEFHSRWRRASDPDEAGDWIALFVAWFDDELYRRPLAGGQMDPIPSCVEEREEFLSDEASMKALNDLDDDQLNWRRWAIVSRCGNSLDSFKQEYPSTPDEAFLASGRPVFNQQRINYRKRQLEAHDLKARHGKAKKRFVTGDVKKKGRTAKFVANPHGYLRVYQFPVAGHHYYAAADVSEGVVKGKTGDRSAIQILDTSTFEQVAVWVGRIPVHEFTDALEILGYYYNTARLVPEANNHGHTVCYMLTNRHYPNLWLREDIDGLGAKIVEKPGWLTNVKTRPFMVDALDQLVNESTIKVNDIPSLDEMLSFVRNPKTGKPEGDEGCHDDLVIALAIGCGALKSWRTPDHAKSKLKAEKLNPDAEMVRRNIRRWKKKAMSTEYEG